MVNEIVNLILLIGSPIITFFIGYLYRDKKQRTKFLKALKIKMDAEYDRLNKRKSDTIHLDIDFLKQIYLEGELSSCSNDFTGAFNHLYNVVDKLNEEYVGSALYEQGFPHDKYYDRIMSQIISFENSLKRELRPLYKKRIEKFQDWKRFDPERWKRIKNRSITIIINSGVTISIILIFFVWRVSK